MPGDWGGDPSPTAADRRSHGPLRSPRGRMRVARVGVIAATVLSGVELATDVWAYTETQNVIADEPDGAATPVGSLTVDQDVVDRLNAAVDASGLLGVVSLIGLLVAAVFVIRWQNVVVGNQRGLGVEQPRYTPLAAGFSWFVPIWSLFGPKRALNDAWRAAAPAGADRVWLNRRVPALFLVWWLTWLAGVVVGRLGTRGTGDDLDANATVFVGSGFSCVMIVAAGILFVVVMEQLTTRQDERIAEAGPA